MMGGQGHEGILIISVQSTKKQPLAKDKGPLEGDRLPPITPVLFPQKGKGILVAYIYSVYIVYIVYICPRHTQSHLD